MSYETGHTWRCLQVRLAEGSAPYGLTPIAAFTGPQSIYEAFRGLADCDREEFWAVALDQGHRVIGMHLVSVGSLSASIIHPREVYKFLLLSNAARWVAVHNHPSGRAEPSREDIAITERLRDIGELMGVQLLDHVIIGGGTYTSMRDSSMGGL